MKAYVYGAGGATVADVAKPAPRGTQVLVRVRACGLNRADLGMTKGHVHGSAGGVGTVLGMEWAGEVAELGPDAKGVNIGDGGAAGAVDIGFHRVSFIKSVPAANHSLMVLFRRFAMGAGEHALEAVANDGLGLAHDP